MMAASLPKLTIRSLNVRPVRVPMRRPLGTSAGAIRTAPLVLIDLVTHEGITGHAYLMCYAERLVAAACALLRESFELIDGKAVAPLEIAARFDRAYRIPGFEGLVSNALSGIDVAAWDALAQAAGVPLVRLLGGQSRPIPTYNSNGLSVSNPDAMGEEARELLSEGFRAVKLRLGYGTLEEDVRAARAVRAAVPAGTVVMSDYNQGLSVAEAIARGRALDGEGLAWIEEPIRHGDYEGCARVAAAVSTPVQIGENFIGTHQLARALQAHASDYVMFDLMRIFGVTGWMHGAAIAEAAGIEVSSHLFPEVSVHLLAATPTAHWLEYVDWAAPILARPLTVVDGHVTPPDRPGAGIAWNEDAVRAYTM